MNELTATQLRALADDWLSQADANDYDGSGDISTTFRMCAIDLLRALGERP